jgi:hypothetical protein
MVAPVAARRRPLPRSGAEFAKRFLSSAGQFEEAGTRAGVEHGTR